MLDSLRWASALCFVVSIVAFGLFSYANAKRTIVPIKKAWEKQRQFAADTSHELRNPLAIIQTNAELLLQSPEHSIRAESTRISAILDNAIRYTEPGGNIQVTCSKERAGLSVCIRDTGIGMSDEDVQAVFQRFYRNDRARFMNPEGMGLGLSIAQWIAERHHAEIKTESTEGKGTTMLVIFKNADASNADQ